VSSLGTGHKENAPGAGGVAQVVEHLPLEFKSQKKGKKGKKILRDE
jgi:hypothetical protein